MPHVVRLEITPVSMAPPHQPNNPSLPQVAALRAHLPFPPRRRITSVLGGLHSPGFPAWHPYTCPLQRRTVVSCTPRPRASDALLPRRATGGALASFDPGNVYGMAILADVTDAPSSLIPATSETLKCVSRPTTCAGPLRRVLNFLGQLPTISAGACSQCTAVSRSSASPACAAGWAMHSLSMPTRRTPTTLQSLGRPLPGPSAPTLWWPPGTSPECATRSEPAEPARLVPRQIASTKSLSDNWHGVY